jgi:hypothetical protein
MRAPILLEIHTRAWLRELSEAAGKAVLLEDIPQSEIDGWKNLGVSHIWLMGVWQVGPAAREHALAMLGSAWNDADIAQVDLQGSPFAIQEYSVDRRLGEPLGLLMLKERLGAAGLKLILDFVPNHFGVDAPDLYRHPSRFVQAGTIRDGVFEAETRFGKCLFAYGRDPYFPPWTDTVQLDYRQAETHEAMATLAQTVSMYGNGLRCDMAMLLLPEIFENTWKDLPPAAAPLTHASFWTEAIPKIRQLHPQVDLIAEAYWDKEAELQAAGFDYTYNKRVYDYLVPGRIRELRDFLRQCSPEYLSRSVHFLENHDEPRIASLMPLKRHKAAAALLLFLPGMAVLHDGQLEGRKLFSRIQSARRPEERPDAAVTSFYHELLSAIQKSYVRRGTPSIMETESSSSMIAIEWKSPNGESDFGIVNFGAEEASFHLPSEHAPGAVSFSLTYSTEDAVSPLDLSSGTLRVFPESAVIIRRRI